MVREDRYGDAAAIDSQSGARDPEEAGPAEEGGESTCWAHLVCPECGAVTDESHRPGCPAKGVGES